MAEDSTEKAQYKQTSGFAADSHVVQIVVPEHKVEAWDREADEQGFDNRSHYLRTLIGEARYQRQSDTPRPQQADDRIDELEAKIERLQDELEQARQEDSGSLAIDDPRFLEQFLTDTYQELSEILQQIVESGALDDLIRKPVEDQLYFMASQNRVEYQRGWGWKLAEEGGQ